MGNPLNHGRIGRDAYDAISADEFLNHRQPRMDLPWRMPRKKRRELLHLIATQKTGLVANSDWWRKYHQYINSPQWRALKRRIIQQRGSNCERCGKFGAVDLHHLTYVRLGRELDEDLKLYCQTCHRLMHPRQSRA